MSLRQAVIYPTGIHTPTFYNRHSVLRKHKSLYSRYLDTRIKIFKISLEFNKRTEISYSEMQQEWNFLLNSLLANIASSLSLVYCIWYWTFINHKTVSILLFWVFFYVKHFNFGLKKSRHKVNAEKDHFMNSKCII